MRRKLAVLALVLLAPAALPAQRVRTDSTFLDAFSWRPVGPANMSGRISDIEANPLNPKVIYVAAATGGIWKTVNAGTTWMPVFDRYPCHSVSELAIAPSDTSIIYAGTGEEDSRNSLSPGCGVFKSTDAGRTWTYMGLRETQAIGRIMVDPQDPNVAYVAALGHAWGPNPDRGLYKTTDGGQNWTRINFISNAAGFVDVAMHPSNHNLLWAASWERQRGPYYLRSGGPGSGLWQSTDAGATWTRITGRGLPTTTLGRIGLAIAPSNPQMIYAMVEADSNPNPESLRRGFVRDTTRRQRLQSGLYRSTDGGASWTKMNDDDDRPFYYSQVRVDPRNPDRVYWMGARLNYSNDGGRTARRVGIGIHSDNHGFWIDPNDPDHYIVGDDGGVAITYDRGRTYDQIMQMALGQFYAVGLDMQRPFWICGGLQDNGSWCGPSRSLWGIGIRNEDWFNVGGGDGFYAQIDPTNPNVIYSESQGGNVQRRDISTWESRNIRPGGQGVGRLLEDSMIVSRGDTTNPTTPVVQRVLDSLQGRIARDTATLTRNRFNWSAPFVISPHNSSTLYMGGHRLWKTVDRGDHWTPISDDLSTRDTMQIRVSQRTTGGITADPTGAETHGTITTVGESPMRPGIIWAGTDDGNVWLTTNDGSAWTNLTGRFPGVPARTWVTRVEPSHFDSATAYVTFDGHRDDNVRPYVFVTHDFGRTFTSIANNLPGDFYVHVIREDPRRRQLLFLGTEYAAFVSTDEGQTWQRLMRGMPTVPVHDFAIHPRDRVIVAATHGRSIFTMEIGPLEDVTDSVLATPANVFAVEPALLYNERGGGGGVGSLGHKTFIAPNLPFGARIPYRLAGTPPPAPADTVIAAGGGGGGGGFGGADIAARLAGEGGEAPAAGPNVGAPGGGRRSRADTVSFVILNATGDTVRTLRGSGAPGVHWLTWDLRRNRVPLGPADRRDSVRAQARLAQLRDSLRTAGASPAAALRDPTPGEPGTHTPPTAGLEVRVGGAGGGGAGGGLARLLGGGTGGGGGGFGGDEPRTVEPGTYVVVMRLNGVEYRRPIRVERPEGQKSVRVGDWH